MKRIGVVGYRDVTIDVYAYNGARGTWKVLEKTHEMQSLILWRLGHSVRTIKALPVPDWLDISKKFYRSSNITN